MDGYLAATDFAAFAAKGSGTVTSVTGSGGTTGLTLDGGPITSSGTLTLGGTLAVANGGTGTSNGSINGPGALTFTAGGSNQNVTLSPSGTGYTLLNGNVGIGTTAPGNRLSITAGNGTGLIWGGTSTVDGVEVGGAGTDRWIAAQRNTGSPLNLSKPTGASDNTFISFYVGGTQIGQVSATGGLLTFPGNITGNAATATSAGSVTNGVVTTGSYANPGWVTSLAGSKISGDIPGNAATATSATTAGSATTAAGLSATLAVGSGGTGKTSVTSGSYLMGNGTGALTEKTPAQVKTDLALVKGDVGLGNVENLKVSLSAVVDPAASDNAAAGWVVGSRWVNISSGKEFVCTTATGTAVWKETTHVVASADVTTALGFTPINKAGDTGIGALGMGALTATTGTFSGAVTGTSFNAITGLSAATPLSDGTAAIGTATTAAKGDHVHPSDTSRVAANAAITGATKAKITYDAKGLVTAGADLASADVTTALGFTPINKAGDTGIGALGMGALTATTGTFSGAVTGTSFNSITALASTASPMDGVAAVGSSTTTARQDHVHPADTTKAGLASPTFTGTVSGITASMVGLANVDNLKNTVGSATDPTVTSDSAAGYAVGSRWVTTGGKEFICTTATAGAAVWQELTATSTGGLRAANNLSDLVSASTARTSLGLGSVDNTSDANKPISTAAQTALDLKAPLASPTFTGTVNAGTVTATGFSGPLTGNVTGNASGSAGSFTGSLVGDVTGTQGATVVSTVGAVSASNVAAGAVLANAATALNTASTIVKRDGAGNFSAGTITAALAGNATTATGLSATLVVGSGGTGATTAAGARTSLGAAASGANSDITSLSALTTPLTVAQGGTGSSTQNYVDLSTAQTIAGTKTFSVDVMVNGITVGKGAGTGAENTASGNLALSSNTTGVRNTASGYWALTANTTGIRNTASGYRALLANTTGSYNTASGAGALMANTTGDDNTSAGYLALAANTTGSNNTASGSQALTNNTTGSFNTASGASALNVNTTGYENTGIGYRALNANTTGFFNTASGANALYLNTTGDNNTASGYTALRDNTGSNNTGFGSGALQINTAGAANTGVGQYAGGLITTGSNNTVVGFQSAFHLATGSNNTAIGSGADVAAGISNSTVIGYGASVGASNTVRIGNASVTSIGGQVAWTASSDRRLKQNILSSGLGLDFILKLRPVTYSFITQPTVTQEGLIAQEVEAAAQSLGVTFHGVKVPATPDAHYSLTYSDFVMPLINSAKELKAENEALKATSETQQARVETQQTRIEGQQAEIDALKAQMAAILARFEALLAGGGK